MSEDPKFYRDEGDESDIYNRVLGIENDPRLIFRLSDPAGMGFAMQSRLPLESSLQAPCKSETKANRTEVLPGSNFCNAILSISFIPFIPVPNPFSAALRPCGSYTTRLLFINDL